MKKNLLIPLFTVVLLISCTEENIDTLSLDDPNLNLDNITYTTHIKGLIDSYCISCHGAVNPSAGFDISTFTKAKNNMNAIISRIDLQTGQAGIMPTSGRMTETTIQTFKNWETQGLTE